MPISAKRCDQNADQNEYSRCYYLCFAAFLVAAYFILCLIVNFSCSRLMPSCRIPSDLLATAHRHVATDVWQSNSGSCHF